MKGWNWGMKRTYILTYPELKSKRTEPLTEEQIKKNKEYSEINRARTRKAANERYESELKFKQFAMSRVGHTVSSETFNTPPMHNNYNVTIKDAKSQLSVYCLSPRYANKLPSHFVDEHPWGAGISFYKDTPIYMNVNLVPYTEQIQPFIFGFLRGCFYNGSWVVVHVYPIVDDNTLKWLYKTHKPISLRVAEDGTFFLTATKRVRDKSIPEMINPLNGRSYTETEVLELSKYINAQKRETKKIKALKEKKEHLNTKLSIIKHNFNTCEPNTADYVAMKINIERMQRDLNGLLDEIYDHENTLKEANNSIMSFHKEHQSLLNGEGWAIKWYNTEEANYMSDVGVVTEQGELGLGFNPLSDEDKKKLKKTTDETCEEDT